MMKTGIIIQARMTSTRLPGKVMLELCGRPVLKQLIERLKHTEHQIPIIIATTDNETDNVIADFAVKELLGLFRGSEKDVLSRYYLAAKNYDLDTVVRITSDCPLYDPFVLDEMLELFSHEKDLDYLSNTLNNRTYPRGLDTEIFTFGALEKSYYEAKDADCREHVTPYIYRNTDKFKLKEYLSPENHSELRWTLDTKEDYKLIQTIYQNLYDKNADHFFSYQEVLEAYQTHPEWKKINAAIEQKKVNYGGEMQ